MGTFENEDTLPRVPLPTVDRSCELFLEWCTPLLTDAELAATEDAVAAFRAPDSPAHRWQAALAEFDATDGVASWVDKFWPSRYLGRRDRIALNANFFFLFGDGGPGDDPAGRTQLARAAGLVASMTRYKLALDREEIPPAMQRGTPLSMVQQKFLFSATRIPGAEQDTVRVQFPSPARHVLVIHRGRMYRMDVVTEDGNPYTATDIAAALEPVLAETTREDTPVGHLTTMARAEWAATREELAAQPGNADALETVETALLCVCLDDVVPADTQQACDQLLHGDSGNRWFDKAVSLVVFGDGTAGINVEHCGLDGTTILAFTDTVLTASGADDPAQGEPPVTPVTFTLTESLRDTVRAADKAFADYAAGTATTTVELDFGADVIKGLGLSPDAFAQLAYQVAHRRAKGVTGATYESIATRTFRHGRTEAMRVITPQMLKFVATMEDPGADRAARRAALDAAAKAHVARAKQCQAGDAPEQHLWELMLVGKRAGDTETAALYDCPGWTVMRDDALSTSSAPSVNIQYFGFGSTSPTCIGVAYVLLPDRWNLYLSTPRTVAEALYAFADQVRTAVTELRDLLSE